MNIKTDLNQLAIGIDVGATKIAAALVDNAGQILKTHQQLTRPQDGTEQVINRIVESIMILIDTAPTPIAGIGIGTPGQHHPAKGIVKYAVNMGWDNLPLVELLQRQLQHKLPIWLENDTNVQALGEYFFGSAQNCDNIVYIGIGSGVGSGAVINGRLLEGATNNATEVGHLSLDPDNGYICRCGITGCVESILSGVGMVDVARLKIESGRFDTQLQNTPELTTHKIIAAAKENDPLALSLFEEGAKSLGFLFAIFVTTLNPSKIVIGGGLGHAAFDFLIPGAIKELERRVLPTPIENLKIVRSQITSSAVGASCLVWTHQETGS
jgi:glucokinase